jgi:hypothetical protein
VNIRAALASEILIAQVTGEDDEDIGFFCGGETGAEGQQEKRKAGFHRVH